MKGPIGSPKTSVQNYHSVLHKIPKNADLIDIAADAWKHTEVCYLFILFLTIFKSRPVYILGVAAFR